MRKNGEKLRKSFFESLPHANHQFASIFQKYFEIWWQWTRYFCNLRDTLKFSLVRVLPAISRSCTRLVRKLYLQIWTLEISLYIMTIKYYWCQQHPIDEILKLKSVITHHSSLLVHTWVPSDHFRPLSNVTWEGIESWLNI